MKKLSFLLILSIFATPYQTTCHNIKKILFDVTSVFKTSDMKASSYVGKIDSMRYYSQVGHMPSQADLFKQLQGISAQSKQITYNNNLQLPPILSDWLTSQQSASQIKSIIQRTLTNKNLSDIEIKVLLAIVSMMLTPSNLADTQKICSHIEKTVQKLYQQGFQVYLIGNWTDLQSLRSHFSNIFSYFSGVYFSGNLKLLKPQEEFYRDVMARSGATTSNSLWIETEPKFIQQAQRMGLNVAVFSESNYSGFVSNLQRFGIYI